MGGGSSLQLRDIHLPRLVGSASAGRSSCAINQGLC